LNTQADILSVKYKNKEYNDLEWLTTALGLGLGLAIIQKNKILT